MIVQAGNDRREADSDRHTGLGQAAYGLEPPGGRRGAGFHGAGEAPVQGRDRHEGAGQTVAAHRPKDVHIAGDQVRFGDDGKRLTEASADLKDRPGRLQLSFHWLIRVGVAAYVDAPADVSRRKELAFQETRGLGLEEDPALEIQARG